MNNTDPQRIMALDIGSVRVGVALSDELLVTAQPFDVLARTPGKKLLQRLTDIINKNNVVEIVVGLPLNLKGEDTESTINARDFADRLKQTFPLIKIVLWDERMTTAASESILIDAGVRRDQRRRLIDKLAAALILDSYLS